MSSSSEVAAVIESVVSRLSALDAIGSEEGWLEEDQIRYVRVLVEEGIEQLARDEDAQFVLIAECAMLAGENMQDARLHIIEERLKPEEATFAGFLVNLGLMLALELAVVAGATYALPAVLAIAATRAQSRNARRLVVSRIAEKQAASKALEPLADAIAATEKAAADALKKRNETPNAVTWIEESEARLAASKAKGDYSVALQALETSEELALQAKTALEAAPKLALEDIIKSPRLRTFLEGVVAPTTVSRVAENSASAAIQKLGESTGAARLPGPFQTSTVVGLFLAETARDRHEAAETWAATKLYIRLLTDDQFINSQLAQQLFFCVHYEPAAAAAQELAATDREAMILGFEGALWLAWLASIDALGKQAVTGVLATAGSTGAGGVNADLVITGLTELPALPPGTGTLRAPIPSLVDGVRYPGLVLISDGQAEYLYGRFAHGFFTLDPKAAPPPLTFEAARYDEVASLPPTKLGFPNLEREQRIGEMKLLVIEFFRIFKENPEAIGGAIGQEARAVLRPLLELAPDADPVGDLLDFLPPISEPDAPAAEEGESGLPPEFLVSMLEASPERAARDAATKLGSLVTDLDLMIIQAASSTEDDERVLAIAAQQDAVRGQYADFHQLASGQTALLDEVRTEYEQRIATLTDWPPPTWKWFDPDTPETPPTA